MKITRFLLIALIISTVLLGVTQGALAASCDITFSSQSVGVGSTFIVTLTFRHDAPFSVEAKLTYDKSAMQYVSGGGSSVNISNGAGTISSGVSSGKETSFSFIFKALKIGSGKITVKSIELLPSTGGKGVTLPTAEAVVSLVAPTPTPAEPTPDLSMFIPVTANGVGMYLVKDLSQEMLPAGYTISQVTYEGQSVNAGVNAETDSTIYYLVLPTDHEGGFYTLDTATNSFAAFSTLIIEEAEYIPLTLADTSILPEGSEPAVITVSSVQINAWTYSDDQFLFYAIGRSGSPSLFIYDQKEGTAVRYIAPKATLVPPTPTPPAETPQPTEPAEEASGSLLSFMSDRQAVLIVLGALILLFVVFLSTTLVIVFKR